MPWVHPAENEDRFAKLIEKSIPQLCRELGSTHVYRGAVVSTSPRSFYTTNYTDYGGWMLVVL